MTRAIQASNGKFYTGRAGEGWLSIYSVEAFTYTREGAERKAELFNRSYVQGCGATFRYR